MPTTNIPLNDLLKRFEDNRNSYRKDVDEFLSELSQKQYDETYDNYLIFVKAQGYDRHAAHNKLGALKTAYPSDPEVEKEYLTPFNWPYGIAWYERWDSACSNLSSDEYGLYGCYYLNYDETVSMSWINDFKKGAVKRYKTLWKDIPQTLNLFENIDFYRSINDAESDISYITNRQNKLQECINTKRNLDGKTLKSSEKEQYLQYIENCKEDIKLLNLHSEECKEFSAGWDRWKKAKSDDYLYLKDGWEKLLKNMKNPPEIEEPEKEPEPDILTPEPKELNQEETPNVIEQPSDNAFNSVSTDNQEIDVSTNTTHTRIYEYTSSTIKLDEMSMPIYNTDNANNYIDPSTGQHFEDGTLNMTSSPYDTTNGSKGSDRMLSVGVSYPLLRINDHYYTNTDVKSFILECSGFLPTIEVVLECNFNDILKDNQIKDGDLCSVFISPGHGTIKSYRGDFLITAVRVKDANQLEYLRNVRVHFLAELFIPSIHNSGLTFSYPGTSRDALIDVANQLGLGFFFSDPDNTEDVLVWQCTSEGEEKDGGDSAVVQYIKYVAEHAWKEFNSFYDCWIDPRYAITFVNIALMLGGSGLDEEIDLAVFNSVLTASNAADGAKKEASADTKKASPKPLLKLLTNITNDENSTTAFFVRSYNENVNGAISNQLGLTNNNYYTISNPGIQQVEESSIEMAYSIPVNSDKLKHGFYILAGPGKNLTYTSGENGSYPDQHKVVQGGQIADTLSDMDAEKIIETGGNSQSSGNTNKFFEVAAEHNLLNNMWLKKKTITVRLNGCNMLMMRGEKIPMILKDNFNPIINHTGGDLLGQAQYRLILPNCCGWFIILSLKWMYKNTEVHQGSSWETELTLTRREWPIPGYVKNGGSEQAAAINVDNNVLQGTVREGVNNTIEQNLQTSSDQQSQLTELQNKNREATTDGLKDFMIDIYNDIKNAVEKGHGHIKLISGRRWAADENGNRLEGAPTIKEGNTWKFVNSLGDVVWYSSNTSKHIYGEAFDIINDQGTSYEDVMRFILSDQTVLANMLEHGVYCGQEQTKDDTGNTIKHYHIGTVDQSDNVSVTGQAQWWDRIKSFNKITEVKNKRGITLQISQFLTFKP